MALASQNKVRWQYTDDDGNKWAMTQSKAITDQQNGALAAKVGGIAADGSEIGAWPSSWRPRKRYFFNGLTRRAVICHNTTCDAWVTGNTTLSLNLGADVATFSQGKNTLGEKKRDATGSTS